MITNDDIRSLFGRQLEKIKNDQLRDKVVATWVEGCKRGGWESVEELTSMPFTLLTDTHGMSFIKHTIAVTEGALGLARAQVDALGELPTASVTTTFPATTTASQVTVDSAGGGQAHNNLPPYLALRFAIVATYRGCD